MNLLEEFEHFTENIRNPKLAFTRLPVLRLRRKRYIVRRRLPVLRMRSVYRGRGTPFKVKRFPWSRTWRTIHNRPKR